MSLSELSISQNCTIKQALSSMGSHEIRMRAVVDDNGKFVGIISDPDIRRGIAGGLNLESPIRSIIKYDPIIAKISDSKERLFELSSKHNIYEIPLMDDSGEIVQIISVLKLLKQIDKPNKVIIMAGGLGTRLRPLTDNIPKPMLKVGNKPILEIILERFRNQGFNNIILCVNYKSDIIEQYFGDGSKYGLNIQYVREDKRLGTAGALSLLKEIPMESFFVMNGDILSDIDFNKMLSFHNEHKSIATMGIREYLYQVPYGVVESENGNTIKKIVEKPSYKFNVSAGIYLLDPCAINMIPKDIFYDMPNLFADVIQHYKENVKSYLIDGYWIDIGRMEEYEKAQNEFDGTM